MGIPVPKHRHRTEGRVVFVRHETGKPVEAVDWPPNTTVGVVRLEAASEYDDDAGKWLPTLKVVVNL